MPGDPHQEAQRIFDGHMKSGGREIDAFGRAMDHVLRVAASGDQRVILQHAPGQQRGRTD